MKRIAGFAAALAMVSASVAHAGTRLDPGLVFDTYAPPPDSYFFDDGYVHESVNAGTESGDGIYGGAGQLSSYGYDPLYYEPHYVPSQKRIDKVRAGLRAAAAKQRQVSASNVSPKVAAKPPGQIALVQPKVSLESLPEKTASKAKLVLPPEKPAVASGAVDCDKGAVIVKGYGFDEVKPKNCNGDIFAFNASRGGKAYEILLSSKNGALTEVRRQ